MNISNWVITDAKGRVLTSTADQNQLDLASLGLNEILQNVKVIVTTRIGSVMLDRLFGLDMGFVDTPMDVAENLIVANLCYALTHFEPRVTFKTIQFSPSMTNMGELDAQMAISIDVRELAIPNN